MRLFIVRHGESEDNVARVISGQSAARLTATGRRQARALGQRLAREKFTSVFSSDLLRAKETTELITQSHTSSFVCYDPALRERRWGIYDNQPVQLFFDAANQAACQPWEFEPEQGESLADLLKRLELFAMGVAALNPNGQYLISAHHAINKVLLMLLLRQDWNFWKTLHQDNTCVNILERKRDRFDLILHNCTAHLSGSSPT